MEFPQQKREGFTWGPNASNVHRFTKVEKFEIATLCQTNLDTGESRLAFQNCRRLEANTSQAIYVTFAVGQDPDGNSIAQK